MDTFRLPSLQYSSNIQFYGLYQKRLAELKPLLVRKAQSKRPDHAVLEKLSDAQSSEGRTVIAVGTMYKDMPLKPSVLGDYSGQTGIKTHVERSSYVSKDDFLALEDESGRLLLVGDIVDPARWVTGVVVACVGRSEGRGEFIVEEFVSLGPAAQQQPIQQEQLAEPQLMALVSGIHAGDETIGMQFAQLFSDWVCGRFGDDERQRQITRVLVAGNAMAEPDVGHIDDKKMAQLRKAFSPNSKAKLSSPATSFDEWLLGLCTGVDVFVMPGSQDPSNMALPQQPLNPLLTKGSWEYPGCHMITNPAAFRLNGSLVVGHAGQPIDNIMRYMNCTSPLEALELTLQWRHIAPTAPDTLSCYPFPAELPDPFVLRECPRVLFAGNQERFETKEVVAPGGECVRLITIPSLAKTGVFVLLNVATFEPIPVSFCS